MRVRTPTDMGAVIRDRRKLLGLDQAALARKVGVNRKWVISIEQGRATAELGLVLRALDVLGIPLNTGFPSRPAAVPPVDIDAIVSRAKETNR